MTRRPRARGLLLAAVFGGLLVETAHAQGSIEASPLRVEIQTEAGGTHTQAVTLTNPGAEAVRVRATVADWHLSREGAPQFQSPLDGRPYAAAAWMRFAPPEFRLGAGRQGTVRFTITVPPGAQPGGYRTSLLFEFLPEAPERSASGRQVILRSRIATLIYVNVGRPAPAIEMLNLQVRGTAEQTQVIAALKNSGRRTVRTRGTLTVSDAAGLAVAQIPVPEVPVLPESERELAVRTTQAIDRLIPGDYKVELKLDLGMPALVVGETTLRVSR